MSYSGNLLLQFWLWRLWYLKQKWCTPYATVWCLYDRIWIRTLFQNDCCCTCVTCVPAFQQRVSMGRSNPSRIQEHSKQTKYFGAPSHSSWQSQHIWNNYLTRRQRDTNVILIASVGSRACGPVDAHLACPWLRCSGLAKASLSKEPLRWWTRNRCFDQFFCLHDLLSICFKPSCAAHEQALLDKPWAKYMRMISWVCIHGLVTNTRIWYLC